MLFDRNKRGSIFVPRELSWGWTLDFTHPGTWAVLLLLLAVVVGIPWLVLSF